MNYAKNIKRLVVTSKELAEALGPPEDIRIVDLSQEVTVQMQRYGSSGEPTQLHMYGDMITLEWEEE